VILCGPLPSIVTKLPVPVVLVPKQQGAVPSASGSGSGSGSGLRLLSAKKKYHSELVNTTNHQYPDYSKAAILPKILAIYFPQFHRDPLNGKLWGKGFTDWDSLKQAPERNRKGFRIPRPTELGYYNLENYTIRKMQATLARQYGVDGFVYHHYWFYDESHPGPTLQAPLMRMLEDGEPNLTFCFHWVPDTWKATWFKKIENDTAVQDRDLEKRSCRSSLYQHQTTRG
jgi:hypothetical protein